MFSLFELAITVYGLRMLITGKGAASEAPPSIGHRILGAFLMTIYPVLYAVGFVFGTAWVAAHPDLAGDALVESLQGPAFALEVVGIGAYVFAAYALDRSVRRNSLKTAAPAGVPHLA